MKNDYNSNYELLEELVINDYITANEILDLFVNWHGLEKLTDEFMEFVKNEIGY